VLDACLDQLKEARSHPWKPVGDEFIKDVALGAEVSGAGLERTALEMVRNILPHHAGNIHPRFFGWVQGSGTVAGLMAEMVAATMNSNCGGRDHGAVYVEREVIRWCAECFGFPSGGSGVLVTGTSQATVLALAAARLHALGAESRKKGLYDAPRLALYASEGVHNAVIKAVELLGIGSDAIRKIPVSAATFGMEAGALAEQIRQDREAGLLPFCVVGTAGSVDLGGFDPLEEIAEVCEAEGLWFHVDGAFGAWMRIAEEPWCGLVKGIERADSLALDFHKWMFVQYDCGLILMRDEGRHRAAFAARPAYLAAQVAGLGGGDPWFCDYGTDLSRSFRALKVWATLRAYGRGRLGAAITGNCRLAALMGRLVDKSVDLELAVPVLSNVCCFSVADGLGNAGEAGALNASIAQQLQMSGEGVFSTTQVAGRAVIRAAITNHRTTESDIEAVIEAVRSALHRRLKNAGGIHD
jgi:aromatic-L-amino-acid/L-tryptophan decarboxylase